MKEFSISRNVDAPRDLVWKMLTEEEHLLNWWGPKGFEMTTATVDLRPGGIFHYAMKDPSGNEMWGKFVYREVVKPEELVFVSSFSDKDAGITRHPLGASWPLEILNRLTLTETGGKTTVTINGGPINATDEEIKTFNEAFSSVQKGFEGTFSQLDEYIAEVIKSESN